VRISIPRFKLSVWGEKFLSQYVKMIDNVQTILLDFKQKGIIDPTRLGALDELIHSSKTDQVRILNISRLSIDEQRSLFSAVRNIYSVSKVMKTKLITASQRHENPTTADLSFEMIQSLSGLATYVDLYMSRGWVDGTDRMNEFSRMVYKKAKYLGFSEDVATQFKEANITSNEVKTFVEQLNQNIDLETDADEDVGPHE
jgi:hypothetical protein